MSEPVLEVRNLDAGYGALSIVVNASLYVGDQEQVLLFGPNGAGKSTLMKALVGLLTPRAGQVLLLGRDLARQPAEQIVRQGVGYVPQLDNVFSTLSVAENLEMGALACRSNRRGRLDAMYQQFPLLAEKRRQQAGTLSGGQRQILAMARALVTEPRILLLDEPTAGLAPQTVAETFTTIDRICAAGTAVLMVEQNAGQALEHVDRGYVMESGQMRLEGPARELLAHEDIGRLYLGNRDQST